jgi:hypothetical protein
MESRCDLDGNAFPIRLVAMAEFAAARVWTENRRCTAHGYHSVLYQLEDEDRCPAHQQSLDTRCPHCRGETPYIVNTSVIEAPFQCVWCHSHYSYGRLSLLSTTPAMLKHDRVAISRRLLLRSGNDIDAARPGGPVHHLLPPARGKAVDNFISLPVSA